MRPNSRTNGGNSVRTPEAKLTEFTRRKAQLKQRVFETDATIGDRAAQYRALRLPPIPDRQAEIVRALDVAELLRNDLMVVGTNAFIAYSLLCNARFPTGVEETEYFDLAWCRGSGVSVAHKSMAPSLAPLPKTEVFEPMVSLPEQEWLLRGRPLSVVVATIRLRACPLYVPDPRWMALHKLWLSKKPQRNALKKPKDLRQGNVLLSACRYFLADTYPLDIDFVLELPAELRELFNGWAHASGFDPLNPN